MSWSGKRNVIYYRAWKEHRLIDRSFQCMQNHQQRITRFEYILL